MKIQIEVSEFIPDADGRDGEWENTVMEFDGTLAEAREKLERRGESPVLVSLVKEENK